MSKAKRTCATCREARPIHAHDKCMRCYLFWRRNGRERTPDDARTVYGPGDYCKRCQHARPKTNGLCGACWLHQYRRGTPRPAHLWRDACRTCKRPFGGTCRRHRGECYTCRRYRRRAGRQRPKHLLARTAPHGWCECGQPAVEVREAHVGNPTCRNVVRRVTLRLCADCRALEERWSERGTMGGAA